jgi:cell wall-associated NlpC family hydrolase
MSIFEAMEYGVCLLSHVSCRAEGSDKSEMVTQLLFGETYSIIESTEKWVKIKVQHDQYDCWICAKQVSKISEDEFNEIDMRQQSYCTELVQVLQSTIQMQAIVLGSTIVNYQNEECLVAGNTYAYQGAVSDATAKASKDKIIEDAFMYLGAPYLWGGRSPFGIDCSGFTQMVYRLNNISLPRDASQQVEMGSDYSFVEEAEPGDLAFFDNEEGNITHVGILLNDGKIIHASGQVRIDKLDHHGIFNEETGKYTHKLRIIKNLL